MGEYVSVIRIGRLVSNVTPEHIAPFKDELTEMADDPVGMRNAIHNIFSPPEKLHVPIISGNEFKLLQKHLGENMLRAEDTKDLADCLRDEFDSANSSGSREVSTLPLRLCRRSKNGYKLTMGESVGVARERAFAKEIIKDFVGQGLPRAMEFSNDHKITQVTLARSKEAEQAILLSRLASLVERAVTGETESFPASLSLGPIAVIQSQI
jgi:hypothetical protein